MHGADAVSTTTARSSVGNITFNYGYHRVTAAPRLFHVTAGDRRPVTAGDVPPTIVGRGFLHLTL